MKIFVNSVDKQYEIVYYIITNQEKNSKGDFIMAYDYREALKADILDYIEENGVEDYEKLYDDLWTVDSVTGNASGSYTFNRAEAEEYVKANIDLAIEALTEFGYDLKHFGQKVKDEEWEYLDVTIRCYLLGEVLAEIEDEAEEV